jgi:hypothetical protein
MATCDRPTLYACGRFDGYQQAQAEMGGLHQKAHLDEVKARYHQLAEAQTAATKASIAITEAFLTVSKECIRLEALKMTARAAVVDALTKLTFTRKATAKRIAPHHNPDEVAKALADLEAEGFIRNDPKRGYIWVGTA